MTFQTELIKSLQTHNAGVAIEYAGQEISFAALSAVSDSIARSLLKQQLGKETVVGILVNDPLQFIYAIVGVIKAGCVFVPIDSTYPNSRISAIIRNTDLRHIVASKQAYLQTAVGEDHPVQPFFIEDMIAPDAAGSETTVDYPESLPDDSIYIYFTSGSTGIPKGIVGKNSSLLQFIHWEIDRFDIDENYRVSQLISPYFDAFLRDVFVPLLAGGTLCIPPQEDDFFTPEKISAWLDQQDIHLIHCVPSVFRHILNAPLSQEMFKNLKYVFLSGESIIPATLKNWYEVFGSRILLANFYGATETTMIRSYYLISPADVQQVRLPIGMPIYNTELLVAKKDLVRCNTLAPGDLYIISPFTSKGYLNDPELTHERFIRIDAGLAEEKIAFDTGDIARRLADGNTELIGRKDRQVKIRGIRIEPDEIEGALIHSGLVDSAVVLKHEDEMENSSLIAFIIRKKNCTLSDHLISAVENYLRSNLPGYLVPSVIAEVAEYPLLKSGKIDRQQLLANLAADNIRLPQNETEAKLLNIWKAILGDKAISTDREFTTIGGNSLSIMRLIALIYKEYNIRVPLAELISNLTIIKQAALIGRSAKGDPMAIAPATKRSSYHLSSAQQRIYFNYELNRKSAAFNLPMAWELKGEPNPDKIKNALQSLVDRHESLRTSFHVENGQLVQVVNDLVELEVQTITINHEDINEVVSEFVRPFDLSKAPLFRCALISAPTRKVLVADVHHIVCDGISQMNLFADFVHSYNGEQEKPIRLQYKDYAEWEHNFKNSDNYLSHREFWLRQFENGFIALSLPVVDRSTDIVAYEGGHTSFTIDRKTVEYVTVNLAEKGITTFSALFAGWYVFISKLSGQDDITIGINTSGRMQPELEDTVGMFAKSLPVRYAADLELPFADLAQQIHKHLLEVQGRQIYDLVDIMSELNKQRAEPIRSLFDVMFVYQDFEKNMAPQHNSPFEPWHFDSPGSKYLLTLFASEGRDVFNFRMEYSAKHFSKEDIELLIGEFKQLIIALATNVNSRVIDVIDKSIDAGKIFDESAAFNF